MGGRGVARKAERQTRQLLSQVSTARPLGAEGSPIRQSGGWRDLRVRRLGHVVATACALGLFVPALAPATAWAAESDPVAAYSFDEDEGEVAHDSFGNHDGTVEGAEWVEAGKYGSALEFDGEESIVTVPDSSDLDLTEGLTLEAWVRPAATAEEWATILAKLGPTEGNPLGYVFYGQIAEEGPPAAFLSVESTYENVIGSEALPLSAWTHVALTSDGEQQRLFIGGELDSVDDAVPLEAAEGALTIGGNEIWGEHFGGRIDEVRVYDEVLGSSEIEEDMEAEIGLAEFEPEPEPEPIAAYSFDEGEGEVAHDSFGSHDGTVEGAEWVEAGKYGSALEFDGEESCVRVPSAADLQLSEALTLEAWARPETEQTWAPLVFKETPEFLSYALYLGASESGKAAGFVADEPYVYSAVASSEALPTETWSHLALTSNGELLRLYVNGELVDTTSARSPESSEDPLTIGCDQLFSEYFEGEIDEVRVYDQALGGAEIKADMKASKVPEVTTKLATEVSEDEATLNGTVNPEGLETTYQFQYTDEADFEANAYANATSVPASPKGIGAGTEDVGVSETIEGLEAGTTYHFRVVAKNLAGTSDGEDETFTTAPPEPVAAYSFDEDEGSTAHDLVGNHDGQIEGAEWTKDGKYGSALVFNSFSQVTVPDSAELDLTDEFTVEAWVRPHFATPQPTILVKEDSTDPFYSYLLVATDGPESRSPHAHIAGSGSTEEDFAGEAEVPSNAWTHVALTSDGSQAKLYINGELDTTHAAVPARSSDGSLRIGGYEHGEGYFDGRIDEVRIYDQVLTSEGIERDRNSAIEAPPAPAEGPVAAYPLDEGEGEVVHDVAGDHDGVIEGAEWTEGKFGNALRFEKGNKDSVSIPASSAFNLTDGLTLEAWVHPAASEEWQPLIVKEGDALHPYALYSGGEASAVPEGLIATEEETEERVQAKEGIPAESWSHLALTSDGEDLRLYVDGELVETSAAATAQTSNGNLLLGSDDLSERYFNGLIDEVRVYNRPLSEEEIVVGKDASFGGPQVDLSGPAFDGPANQLISPDASVTVDAYNAGQGFSSLELLIDGEVERVISIDEALADGGTQHCEAGVCHFTYSFSAGAASEEYPSGPHVIAVKVVDEEGQSTARSREVLFDDHAPKVRLEGGLAYADGGLLEEEEATLLIKAEDGSGKKPEEGLKEFDSGVEELRVAVDGEITLVEHFNCEAGCPEPATAEFIYNKAEWGEGPHAVDVYAFDAAGNEATERILVDAQIESADPVCPSSKPASVSAVEPITAAEAEELIAERLPGAVGPNGKAEGEEAVLLDPHWSFQNETYAAREAFTAGWLTTAPGGALTVGSAACIAPTVSTPSETEGERLSGSFPIVVHANSAPQTDTVVRATSLGSAIIESFRGASAPSSFSWKAKLAENEEFQELSNGAVALVKPQGVDIEPAEIPSFPSGGADPEMLSVTYVQLEAGLSEIATANSEVEGQVMAVIPPPVVIDVEGNAIEGSLSASGDTITAIRPEGSTAMVLRVSSAPNPVAMCARTASPHPTTYAEACGPEEAGDSAFVSGFTWRGDSIVYALETFTEGSESQVASSRLYAANGDGAEREALTGPNYLYFDPQVSADGATIVATRCDLGETHCGVHTLDADGSNDHLVFEDEYTAREYHPTFGPSDDEVYFFHNLPTGANEEALERQLYYIDAEGTNERQITDVSNTVSCPDEPPCNLGISGSLSAPSVNPDGEEVVFTHNNMVWTIDSSAEVAGLEEMDLLTELEGEEAAQWPRYSPDGMRILYYYEASPSGSSEDGVFSMTPAGSEKTRVVPYEAGSGEARFPAFSADEEEIAYTNQGKIFAVDDTGANERLVSDGDEQRSLVQVVATGDAADVAAAEAVEEEQGDIELLISLPSGGYPSPNEEEIAFCTSAAIKALECWYFYDDRNFAIAMREKVFTARRQVELEADRSTRGNAFQHGLWTALMVRHSFIVQNGVADGLLYALLHEGKGPYSWDARMDVLNDFVGNKYAFGHNPDQEWKVCEGLRLLSRRDIFIGAHINPFRWANEHNFHYRHLVFRRQKAHFGTGPIVKLNGRVCQPPTPS
jgi:Tol biopolymer transport system component